MARWSSVQDPELHEYYKNGTIDPTNNDPQYLFEATRNHFKSFLREGRPGRDAAVARLRLKSVRYLAGEELAGSRRRAAEHEERKEEEEEGNYYLRASFSQN